MNKRETICVNALLRHLKRETGAVWSISDDALDTRYPDRRTPECIIIDRNDTAAVEVKALKGPQDQSDFFGDLKYLKRVLAPQTPGHVIIGPPYDNSPRWDPKFIRLLKADIERVAPTLQPGGEKGYLNIPRRCRVVRANERGAWASCYHGRPEPLRAAGELVSGMYMLIDEEACASVDSHDARHAFIAAVTSACNEVKNGEADVWVKWLDVWPIWRLPRRESSVEVIAVWGAFSVPAAVNQTIWKAVQDGKRKFDERWANRHILLLDSQFHFTDVDAVKAVLGDAPQGDFAAAYGEIDEIVLYWDKRIWPVFRKSATVSTV